MNTTNGDRDAAGVRILPPLLPLGALLLGALMQRLWPLDMQLPLVAEVRSVIGWAIASCS